MKSKVRARFGETAVSMGYVCKQDVAKALKMQSYRRQKGQNVPRIGVLLERMGCLTAAQIQSVSVDCLPPNRNERSRNERSQNERSQRSAQGSRGATASSNRFAPALEPIRRLNGTSSVQEALGWLGTDPKPRAPVAPKQPPPPGPPTPTAALERPRSRTQRSSVLNPRRRRASESPESPAPESPAPEARAPEAPAKEESKLERAVNAVLEPKARPQRLVQDELDRLRETITRLTLKLAKVETEAESLRDDATALRSERDALQGECDGLRRDTALFREELEAVTNAMIFKEDLIDALRNQVKRLGS